MPKFSARVALAAILFGAVTSSKVVLAQDPPTRKPGQKPGDVFVEGMGGMNVNEMTQGMDPKKMQEMMQGMDPKQMQEMIQKMQQMQRMQQGGAPPR